MGTDSEIRSHMLMQEIGKLFDALGERIVDINKANGWDVATPDDWHNDSDKIPRLLCLIHSEVSEALEAFRKQDQNNFKEEMADIFIRCLDMLHGIGFNIAPDVGAKIEKNARRGYKHGGKKI